jgi:hypothetical protein
MMTIRGEAIAAARRLLRGFAGAPDQRRHAQLLYSELSHAEGWSKKEQDLITGLGLWLQERPILAELKPRCEQVLTKLG